MYAGVVSVKTLSDFKLKLVFDNGEEKIFDMKPYFSDGIFSELTDPKVFATARVVFDSVEWANGADISPIVLYNESIPVLNKAS